MTTGLKKKKNNNKKSSENSSLSRDYVDKFINNIETKLISYNVGFLTPYKKRLNEFDPTVINDIKKDLKLPTLLVKGALDELWNHHWILGQKDVIKIETKTTKFSSNLDLITFATIDPDQKIQEYEAEKARLQTINKQVIKLQRQYKEEVTKNPKDPRRIEGYMAGLRSKSTELEELLGTLRTNTVDKRNKQFASVEVRIRDLQESIRATQIEAYENTNNTNKATSIDILNSSEFGTIYQDKRTLLLSQGYSQDYKDKVVKKIQSYFNNTNGQRPNTREQTLFDSLTTKQDTESQRAAKETLKTTDKLRDTDRQAKNALDSFINKIGNGNPVNDRQLQLYATGEDGFGSATNEAKVERDIAQLKAVMKTTKSKLFAPLAIELINALEPYKENKRTTSRVRKVKNYDPTIKNLLKTIKDREKKNTLVGSEYKLGAYDVNSNTYKTLEELEDAASSVFTTRRIKKIAETEISLAYNLGRVKKLEELGYTKVKITNELENRVNMDVALSKFGSLAKAYKARDIEEYMPILCYHCLSRNGQILDISEVYQGKVDTKYDPRFSKVPPFHVSCWCYFVGVDDRDTNNIASGGESRVGIDDALILSGVGLLSVAGAYLAFGRLGKNRVDIPKAIQNVKERIQNTAQNAATNVGNAIDDLLGRPKVNIPLKRLEEIKKATNISDEVFDVVQTETNQLLKIPVNFAPKTPVNAETVEEVLLDSIDEVVSDTAYPTLNNAPKTFNAIIEEIPDYVQSLQPIIKAREEYYRLRNIIYDTTVALETRQSLYPLYISSRTNYDSLITRHLANTRDLKNTVNSMQSQISVDANRQLLANRNNLPSNLTLDEALNSVRTRKALTFTDNQLKAIRDNLALERKGLRDKIGVESKVLDSALDGIDTQQKSLEIKSSFEDITQLNTSYTPKPKTLNKVVSEISSIKRELNNISRTKDTIRSLSTSRITSNSTIDRQLLIDTQQTYINRVLEQQKAIYKELAKLPSDTDKLDNFVDLYRSEILDKVDNSYPYSRNTWSSKELTDLKKQYTKASDIVTTRNTYQSYLDETEDMLSKLSNFETTIVDTNIKFSMYGDDIIMNRELLSKISKLPSIDNIVFN